MNYNEFIFAAQKVLAYEPGDTEFLDITPRMIESGEQRIYSEFDFLATLASQTVTLAASTQSAALPANIVVPQSFNIIPGAVTATGAVQRVSVDYINYNYPPGSTAGQPRYCALLGNPTIGAAITAGAYNLLFGPIPDQNYSLAVLGTVRPSPMSPANPSTFLGTILPDLFFAACMIWGFGQQQNFGAQSDNPQAAQSWETQYQLHKQGLNLEELRRKAASVSWTAYSPTPMANVQRERGNASAPA